jgi:hypothetical protein
LEKYFSLRKFECGELFADFAVATAVATLREGFQEVVPHFEL